MNSAASESPPVENPPPASPTPSRTRGGLFRKLFVRVWLPLVAVFVIYLYASFRATGFDPRLLASDADVTVVHTADAITFTPAHDKRSTALVFIPGSMVDPDAYAPLAHAVAEKGFAVVIPKLPLRTAPLDSQRRAVVEHVKSIIESGSPGTRWVVAGHSLGGVLACRFARDHEPLLAGLVLIGTSHPRDFDLAHLTADVTKITATRDGLASPEEVMANAKQLPAGTHWVSIEGGNHSQFGYYGFQLGDHRASISRADQQTQTLRALLDALERASSPG